NCGMRPRVPLAREVRGQRAAKALLDDVTTGRSRPTDERSGALVRLHRKAEIGENVDEHTIRDGFGIDENAIAVEDCQVEAHVSTPNVRHERRRKGREAAFGTSARWRG